MTGARRAGLHGTGHRVRSRQRRRSELHRRREDPERRCCRGDDRQRAHVSPAAGPVVVVLPGRLRVRIHRARDRGRRRAISQALVRSKSFRLVSSAAPELHQSQQRLDRHRRAPAVHGISGIFFLDRRDCEAVMMNDTSFCAARRFCPAFSKAGASCRNRHAKDSCAGLLGHASMRLRACASRRKQRVSTSIPAALSEETLAEACGTVAVGAARSHVLVHERLRAAQVRAR